MHLLFRSRCEGYCNDEVMKVNAQTRHALGVSNYCSQVTDSEQVCYVPLWQQETNWASYLTNNSSVVLSIFICNNMFRESTSLIDWNSHPRDCAICLLLTGPWRNIARCKWKAWFCIVSLNKWTRGKLSGSRTAFQLSIRNKDTIHADQGRHLVPFYCT